MPETTKLNIELKRINYAIQQLEKKGIVIDYQDNKKLKFTYKSHPVTIYPYSGWFSGKTVKDGRGIAELINQLKP